CGARTGRGPAAARGQRGQGSHGRPEALGHGRPTVAEGTVSPDPPVRSRPPDGKALADQPPGVALPDQREAVTAPASVAAVAIQSEHDPMNAEVGTPYRGATGSGSPQGPKPRRRKLPDGMLFLEKFLRHGKEIARTRKIALGTDGGRSPDP